LVDEDDVFTEAFLSFCAAARREGALPELAGRDNVIRVLARLTLQKVCEVRRREERRRRRVRGESVLGEAGFDPFPSREPPPEFEAEINRLLDLLETDELRTIALMRMHRYGREEIAAELGCSVATLDRRLAVIRSRWRSSREEPARPNGANQEEG
jgi:DNA-directed RNA polymerase specialized sigma24 family protein